MKNKIIISFLSLCALLSSASCSKDGVYGGVDLPGANLSILLRVDGPAISRTSGSTVDDLPEESAITNLDICLIKTDGLNGDSPVIIINNSNNPKDLAWKPLTEGANEYEVNVIVADTITGDYLLYVIANRPSWMTIGKYSDICGSFSGNKDEMAECWGGNNFLMVNAQDDIDASAQDVGVPVTMNPSGEKVTASVTIERIATKIRVKKNYSMEVAPLLTQVLCTNDVPEAPDVKGAIAAMSLEGYALFNCVNSFNLIQRWGAGSVTGDQLLISPSSYTGAQEDHSDAYSITDGYYDNVPSSLVFDTLGTVFYCMENNSPYYKDVTVEPGDATAGTKMKGRVTGLVFKARAGFAKSFSGEAIIAENLSVDTLNIPWVTKGAEDNTTNEDIFWTTLYQYKGDYYGDIPCLLKHNAALATALGTTEPTVAQLREKGVKVYENGYMYYNYWIKDPNYTDGGEGKNYLSVMRNTFYDINITAINSLGDEFPCGGTGYTPADPISVDVPKLNLSIDIPDWADLSGNYIIQ